MTDREWNAFVSFRNDFKQYCTHLNQQFSSVLKPLQKDAALAGKTPEYPFETAVVYNSALDSVTQQDQINLIVIGDNPGKDEQLAKNRKYLVGQSGKIAAGFFARHAEFNTDFRKNVIILNKTPVHTAKTSQIKYLIKNGGPQIEKLILDSQIYMAQKTAQLHQAFRNTELWLVGYAELKGKGLFIPYRDNLLHAYDSVKDAWNRVFVFQHFSMNRFSIDLNEFCKAHTDLSLSEATHALGTMHKDEIFG